MKINAQKDQLLDKLHLVSRFTSNRLSASVTLQGVLVKTEGKKMHFYSTNLSTYFHTSLPIQDEETVQTVIDPKKVIEFLNLLNPGEISLELVNNQLLIVQGKTKGSFPVLAADDFPLPPTLGEKAEPLDSAFLLKNLPLLLFTASPDETRPVLTGIDFVNSEEELLMVATDGFRLSLIKERNKAEMPSMIVPSDFLEEVLKSVKTAQKVLFSFSREEKIVKYVIGEDEYYSRLIDGDFPPFEKVILTESKTKVKVDRAELLRNVKLISIFARDFSSVVICEFKKDGLYLKPKKEANEENTAFQEIEIEGEEQRVAFNYKFLIDLLNHVEDKMVTIEILRGDAPVAFKLETNPAFLHIIMPVRVQE